MNKILGIDLGTNSIGMTLRSDNFFEWYGVYTFRKGVGDGKSGEFSLAAERTSNRSSRRLYNARRYRKWETLKVLIENGFCPLHIDKLNKWKNYTKAVGRIFPVDDTEFNDWIKLDFDGDGKPDYSSPYQLRRELISVQLDLKYTTHKHKIGRALYHIAQRRGFKSSRKTGKNEKSTVFKGSGDTTATPYDKYKQELKSHQSLGAYLAHLEDEGVRIRNRYTLRSDYSNEVNKILNFQNAEHTFREKIVNAIFFQRPLRSQKGLVGKCTMETKTVFEKGKKVTTGKPRCPISHPQFELYRAWSFVNNIKYRFDSNEKFEPLPLELKNDIISKKLLIKDNKTTFKTIRNFICRNERENWELNYSSKMDKMTVSTCPVSAHLKAAFGDNWERILIETEKTKTNKNGNVHKISYTIEDIWHIAFSFEDEEYYEEFLIKQLKLEEEQIDQLKKLWNALPTGYANLSLKAINNILPFLKEGIIYSEAVFLAKIPEIIGVELFEDHKEGILEALQLEISKNRQEKTIVNITNSLVADYKVLPDDGKFGYKNIQYRLDELDKKDILKACVKYFGKNRWNKFETDEQKNIIDEVSIKYQEFFATSKRDYFKQPKLVEHIQSFLINEFGVSEVDTNKMYHPSMIDIYPSTENQQFLKSPKTRTFKNPMAYKTLHNLRYVINHLIEKGLIDSETRVIVEVARELNDKNKRAAIEDYQRNRERENQSFSHAISEILKLNNFKGKADPNSKKDRQKFRLWTEQIENYEQVIEKVNEIERNKKIKVSEKDIKKYRLWKEQKCICLYTGQPIKMSDLFDDNIIDFEHTIPRSKSFDNSLANLTVCYASYNRDIKKNLIPSELPNYKEASHGFTAIEPRLKDWEKKVEALEEQIDFWKFKSKIEQDKSKKDSAIRKRHLLEMDYAYWKNKVNRFTREDVPVGFRNSQLIDTQLISKYAYHYLKTVFNQVDTIKGDTTSEFRKIYGVQPKFEAKDRSKHYHHAIDAAVLTLLPTSAKRKEILEKAYQFEEANPNKQYLEKPFESFNYSMISKIENEILIHNIKDQDQTLTPSRKLVRKRGKIEYLRDEKGNYLRDENKERIPKVATGHSVRGQLHLDTFYGKIKQVKRDENFKPLRDSSGKFLYPENGGYRYVLRIPLEKLTSLEKVVDPHMAKMIEKQLNGRTLKKTISDGVFMIDKNGVKVNRIRRIRVFESVNPIKIKEQTYKSSKDYKNFYYAKNAENYAFAYYLSQKGKYKITALNLFQASQFDEINTIKSLETFFEKTIVEKKQEYSLVHIFRPEQKVIFYIENKEELLELGRSDISKRLYTVKRLYQASRGNIQFQHHLESRNDDELKRDYPSETICNVDGKKYGKRGVNGFSVFSLKETRPRLLLSANNWKFVIEKKDFEIELDGTINWKF